MGFVRISHFLTDYSITYTNRDEEIEDPLLDGRFPAFRFSLDYMNQFGSNSQYDNDFTFLPNLKKPGRLSIRLDEQPDLQPDEPPGSESEPAAALQEHSRPGGARPPPCTPVRGTFPAYWHCSRPSEEARHPLQGDAGSDSLRKRS